MLSFDDLVVEIQQLAQLSSLAHLPGLRSVEQSSYAGQLADQEVETALELG